MDPAYLLQVAAVTVEAAVAAIALFIGMQRKRHYGWLLALAFAIFVLFDLVRLAGVPVSPVFHSSLLLIAAVSSLAAMRNLLSHSSSA